MIYPIIYNFNDLKLESDIDIHKCRFLDLNEEYILINENNRFFRFILRKDDIKNCLVLKLVYECDNKSFKHFFELNKLDIIKDCYNFYEVVTRLSKIYEDVYDIIEEEVDLELIDENDKYIPFLLLRNIFRNTHPENLI